MEVHQSLPSLQFFARQTIRESLEDSMEEQLKLLPLPEVEIERLALMIKPTIQVG